ncbi:MAG TPA: glycosyl hydrolase family 28 protein [Candidatus Limnocylindrales bacterium]
MRPLLAALVMVLSLAVAPASPAAAAVPGATPVLGEHFNDTPTGSVPAGWGVDTSGGSVGVQAVPDAVDRSLAITKTSTTGSALAERRFDPPLTGTVHIEARVRVSQTTGWSNVLYVAGSSGLPAASIAIRSGQFADAGTGQNLLPATADRWYVVRAVLRPTTARFDIFIDGRRVLAGAPFRSTAADIGRVTFGIGPGQTGILRVDSVTARSEPPPTVAYQVLDLFDEAATGAAPPGYELTTTGGSALVSPIPSAADRSLRLVKTTPAGEAKAIRPFPAQTTGTLMVQATVRTDETTGVKMALYAQSATGRNVASIQFSNRVLQLVTGSTVHILEGAVRPSEWYTIRLVLDIPARAVTVFVDGKRFPAITPTAAPTHWTFRDPLATDVGRVVFGVGDGQVGTVHTDKVMVYAEPGSGPPPGTVKNVRDFGARGDGVTDDTLAIQAAIDSVPPNGSVFLGQGIFVAGTIELKSDMTLYIDDDAMLLGTHDDSRYPDLGRKPDRPPAVGGLIVRALIYSHRADRVVITGGGVINGNGGKPSWIWSDTNQPHESTRPAALFLTSGSDITVRGVHVKDAAVWAVVPAEVDGLTIADVDIDSRYVGHRDGIDVVDSHDVLIERVNVNTDDDAICFKSHTTTLAEGSPSRGVDGALVRLSTVGGSVRANGVKFGTASAGAFRNVVVEDVLVKRTNNSGLVVTNVGGAIVHNLTFRRITIDQAKRALFVLLGRSIWTDSSGMPHSVEPKWVAGLRFEDVTATRLAEALPSNHLGNGSAMSGSFESATGVTYRLYDILLSNVRLSLAKGGNATPTEPIEYTGNYPESTYWTTLGVYGFFFRHITGLTVVNSQATVPDPNGRVETMLRDVLEKH